MPALPPGSTILVTGGTGFIGSWVIKVLLDRGFSVRAAVRSQAKAIPLSDHFDQATEDGKLSFTIVEDITKDGAFDAAVVGVDGIAHLASPLSGQSDDPDDLIKPAVNGTLSILKSAALPGSTVKRVVYVSSALAITRTVPGRSLLDENDWSDSPELVEKLGKGAPSVIKYMASKTLAERAAWSHYDKVKGTVDWDVVVLNPPLAFGPTLIGTTSPESLSGSVGMWYSTVVSDTPKTREALAASWAWIDVRDAAEAHALAFEKDAAGGERIIISQGTFIWQEWVDITHSLSPNLPEGYPDLVQDKRYVTEYSTKKEAKIFGIQYRTKEETARDLLEAMQILRGGKTVPREESRY